MGSLRSARLVWASGIVAAGLAVGALALGLLAPAGAAGGRASSRPRLEVARGHVVRAGVVAPATTTDLRPNALALAPTGTLYIADLAHHVVDKVTPAGTLSIVAGEPGRQGPPAPGPATTSLLNAPSGLALAPTGALYIATERQGVVLKVTPTGTLSIVAGQVGKRTSPVPDGKATTSDLLAPIGLAVDPTTGALYIADSQYGLVEKVTPSGTASVVAGITGTFSSPSCRHVTRTAPSRCLTRGPALGSGLYAPSGLAIATGSLFIADTGSRCVERVTLSSGIFSIIAGTIDKVGPGPGPGTSLGSPPNFLPLPTGLAVAGGKLYIATPASNTVEAITLSTSSAAIVAGRPGSTGSPTTGPATTSELNEPGIVVADATGFYIGDINNNEVEKVTPHGTLSVFAGTGTAGRVQTPGTTPANGYRLAASDGGVFSFGKSQFYGSEGGKHLNAPVVGTAATPTGGGYWLVSSDGGVFAFGNAQFYGSEGGKHLNAPVVGMAAAPTGGGYWLVAADGGVFAFGSAKFKGSEGGAHLDAAVVGMAPTLTGGGYWLVAADGGVFAFGKAQFRGSEGGKPLNAPVVGMAPTPTGGYWLVAADGGVFAFGGATFYGSMGGTHLNAPVVGMAANLTGAGYTLVAADGGVFCFGTSTFRGSEAGKPLNAPAVGAT
ncbi:MAG: NHL repeat-containing protein [Acidimicrobiales bacterium]